MESFQDLESEYWRLDAEVDFFAYLQPINVERQKRAFLAERRTRKARDPELEYHASTLRLRRAREHYQSLESRLQRYTSHPLYSEYRELLHELADSIRLMTLPRNAEGFRVGLTRRYGVPSMDEIHDARNLLQRTAPPEAAPELLSSGDVARTLRAALNEGYCGWTVVESTDMSAKASVNTRDRTVKVRANARFSETELHRYVVHEIGVHVTRYENGLVQPWELFRYGFPGYLETEEGLAAVAEERAKVTDVGILRRYAGRMLASDVAARGSFTDVFEELVTWFKPSESFDIALRVKRGLVDTGLPGGYTKDLVYFRGYRALSEYCSAGGSLEPLMVGKVGLCQKDQLAGMLALHQIEPPRYMPPFLAMTVG